MLLKGKTQAQVNAEKLAKDNASKRAERDALLDASDKFMLEDSPWDKQEAKAYRQALRDITKNPNWPYVEFPLLGSLGTTPYSKKPEVLK